MPYECSLIERYYYYYYFRIISVSYYEINQSISGSCFGEVNSDSMKSSNIYFQRHEKLSLKIKVKAKYIPNIDPV
jgi:hypothetical protein